MDLTKLIRGRRYGNMYLIDDTEHVRKQDSQIWRNLPLKIEQEIDKFWMDVDLSIWRDMKLLNQRGTTPSISPETDLMAISKIPTSVIH